MLTAHGFWSPGRGLCLWGEDSERAVKSPSQALHRPRPHPFAAGPSLLADHLLGEHGSATLLLPSLRSAPLDSPELVRVTPRPPARTQPKLLAWTIPVVRHDAVGALQALDAATGAVRFGASLRFLARTVDLARDLAARARVLPGLQQAEGGPVAVWRPVLQGPDLVALHDLVAAMPPVCRAEEPENDDAGKAGRDPTSLVTDAVQALADAAMRERLVQAGGEGWSPLALLPPRRGRRPKRLPAGEAWVAALSTPDGRLDADAGEVDALERALAPWDDLDVGTVGPARATFRLDEPTTADDGGWRLEFGLQSIQDPSLVVPAEQAWDSGNALRRWLDRPQELLLGELGRASRLYPELAHALHQAKPAALELDADGAYHFLSTVAASLDEAGFGVMLPSWWKGGHRIGLAASATTPTDAHVASGGFGRDQLVDFEWRLALGDDVLTQEEIEALTATKEPLVRLRGQWVAMDPEQVRRGLEFLRQEPPAPRTAAEVVALAATHPDDTETPLPVSTVRADGWLGDLLSGAAERSLEQLPEPAGLRGSLRPYQRRGVSWLSFLATFGLGACLSDDMGLGKTIQLLALESLHREDTPGAATTLLVCPMSLIGNWQREAARFVPDLRVYAHHGRERLRGEYLDDRVAETDLVVTTYTTATKDIEELVQYAWGRVVLDEAQAVKNRLSQSATAVRRLEADHRVALTGTPMENRLSELWSVMDFLNPGILGSPETFRSRYAIPVERHGETEPAERLRTITRPYVLRRLKTDPQIAGDLPDKIEIAQHCHLTTEQAALYQVVVDDMMAKIEDSQGIERRGNVLAAMAKLKQVCNHPAQVLHDHSAVDTRSGKVTRLDEILEEILAEGDKVLCFTQFTEFAELLLPHLSARFGQEVLYLHGGTPRRRRDEIVERFQSESGPGIFLLSLKAGGTGLNLTAANHVIHLDRWWNPAVEDQATDRAFRIGQQRNVEVHKFVCLGTLEERIDTMIEEKKALADLVVSEGEEWVTEMSTGDLRDMFALSDASHGASHE